MQFYRIGPYIMRKKWLWTQVPLTDLNEDSREYLLKPGAVVNAEYDYGQRAGDFLGNSSLLTIVSPKVLDILTKFESVWKYTVEPKGFKCPFQYTGVVVSSEGHKFNVAKSKAEYLSSGSLSDYDGIYFDDWNGDDIIWVKGIQKAFLVSERVVGLLQEAAVTNCRYTPTEECRCGKYFRFGHNY